MNGEELKMKLEAGGIVYGTMLALSNSVRWVKPMSTFGLDYIILDTEHTPRGRDELADFLAAFSFLDLVMIVRVPIPDAHYVTMAIDAGSQGVLAPYCETVEEAKEVVGATKLRPLKGALLRKAVETGEFPSQASKEYLENLNRNNVCIIGIESVPAIDNLDQILKVDGIDGIFVGPNDLSISLGVPNEYDHPDYEAALRRILSICKAHNTPTLIHNQTVPMSQKWLREGARFVLHASDQQIVPKAFREEFGAIKAVGEELGGGPAKRVAESKEVL